MSENAQPSSAAASGGLPAWLVTGVLGLAVGVGGTMLGMTSYGYALPEKPRTTPGGPASPAGSGGPPAGGMMGGGGAPGGGMMGGGGGMMGGGGGMMGGGGGMMGGGGGMMGGGGGAGGGKRALTSLIGKLELLSRKDLTLKVELTPEQNAKLAEMLATLQSAEKMTGEEATAFQKSLEELLSKEQNDLLSLIGLPFGGGGGGGGRGGGMGGGMMGGAAPSPDENPFTQETNQKRLRDLLERVKPAQ